MLISSRRIASPDRFAGRNRLALSVSSALEQAGGMLLSPIVIVAVCSLLTSDLTDMVLPAVAATVAWIAGYSSVPVLLARARRRLPWTVGASIVRAASLALLAYVLAGDDVSRDQRLRSILICVAAYAFASGLARGAAESLVARVTTARRPGRWDPALVLLPAGLALLVGIGSFTLLVDVPRSPLPRLSTLFALGAALSGAAVLFLGRVVESPNLTVAERRPSQTIRGWRRQRHSVVWLTVAAVSGAAELLILVGVVRNMELQRAYLLSGIGVFLAASAVASLAGAWFERSMPIRTLVQAAGVLSGIAFSLSVGLPTLLDTELAPDRLFGRQPTEVGVWATMALVGMAQQARRRVLPRLADHTSTSPTVLNVAGFVLAFVPLVLVELFERWEPRSWLILGLGVALLGIAVSGAILPQRASFGPVRQARPPGRTRPLINPASGRYTL